MTDDEQSLIDHIRKARGEHERDVPAAVARAMMLLGPRKVAESKALAKAIAEHVEGRVRPLEARINEIEECVRSLVRASVRRDG